MGNKTETEEIFINGIPVPQTKPVSQKPKIVPQTLEQLQQNYDALVCLQFLSQLRLLTFGLLMLIFVKVVQILEIVRNANFCR